MSDWRVWQRCRNAISVFGVAASQSYPIRATEDGNAEADMRKKYWKKFYKENPPGRGRYKSAYKNMDRLIRTEVTRAYREGTAEYARKKKWVKGIQWHRTSGHGICTSGECDEYEQSDLYGLGDGVYPPDALPISHANCQCYITLVPIEQLIDIDKI